MHEVEKPCMRNAIIIANKEKSLVQSYSERTRDLFNITSFFGSLYLLEEVITLIINKDECREVNNVNLPYSLHAELWVLYALNALDVA